MILVIRETIAYAAQVPDADLLEYFGVDDPAHITIDMLDDAAWDPEGLGFVILNQIKALKPDEVHRHVVDADIELEQVEPDGIGHAAPLEVRA